MYHPAHSAGQYICIISGIIRAAVRMNIEVSEDEKGRFLAVTGLYEYYKVFDNHYAARPMTKLYEGSTLLDIILEIENLGSAPMDLMYQCHINNATQTICP